VPFRLLFKINRILKLSLYHKSSFIWSTNHISQLYEINIEQKEHLLSVLVSNWRWKTYVLVLKRIITNEICSKEPLCWTENDWSKVYLVCLFEKNMLRIFIWAFRMIRRSTIWYFHPYETYLFHWYCVFLSLFDDSYVLFRSLQHLLRWIARIYFSSCWHMSRLHITTFDFCLFQGNIERIKYESFTIHYWFIHVLFFFVIILSIQLK